MIFRLFVEKKAGFDNNAKQLRSNIVNLLGIIPQEVREFIRYDIEGLNYQQVLKAKDIIFSEPPVDIVYEQLELGNQFKTFTYGLITGQFDQRADSAAQCAELLVGVKPIVRCGKVVAISGISDSQLKKIIEFSVNPLECQLLSDDIPDTLSFKSEQPEKIGYVENFTSLQGKDLTKFRSANGFAMSTKDLKFIQAYFASESRQPTTAELKVIDTYWSDHCRHTTFLTELKSVEICCNNPKLKQAYDEYCELYKKHNGKRKDKYHCLMDIATIAVKELSGRGLLANLDVSDEINACTIKTEIDIDGKKQQYLILFKNETHNHPTEIEPFGGAATCIGGAIRDPLSGRAYVYQSMRISGAGDITEPLSETLTGKLPQRIISTSAAAGFSSYGNQIGLSTGLVKEVFHNGYKAKRLECGFVVGSVPLENVTRSSPVSGDKILLIGGATGRDGCGGATGSSKSHTESSVKTCGAEVQKGNAPVERKLQRLYRNPNAVKLIKKCNDFGAGGVSVAIGELADSLEINLDAVPTKYSGLSGTELAISESQERMAVVVSPNDVDTMIEYAKEENLDATVVATVNDSGFLTMNYQGQEIVRLRREFLNTNGVKQRTAAKIYCNGVTFFDNIDKQVKTHLENGKFSAALAGSLANLNVCSQKGLIELFDSTVGASSVMLPLGGKKQLTESLYMAAKITPNSDTCTVASWGFNPHLCEQSPFIGAQHSVLLSIAKLIAAGVYLETINLSFQEFFPKMTDSEKWGQPVGALLGALKAQIGLEVAAIGGKDSMSGTFKDLDVPPTLISFALGISDSKKLISNTIDKSGLKLYWLPQKRDEFGNIDFEYAKKLFKCVTDNIDKENIEFATVVEEGGVTAAIAKSCFGNTIGFSFKNTDEFLFKPYLGDIIVSLKKPLSEKDIVSTHVGTTKNVDYFAFGTADRLILSDAVASYTSALENIYPTQTGSSVNSISTLSYNQTRVLAPFKPAVKPLVIIPVFPGTNGEYDMARQFVEAGAEVRFQVIRNSCSKDIIDSVKELSSAIDKAQIIAFSGGFSAGDEPDGSGKFIASVFSSEKLKESIYKLLNIRAGLTIGICNGFQALIKLGLLPQGKIAQLESTSPTLTHNNIARHVSTVSRIRIASCMSPWMRKVNVGEVYDVVVSHGEGRFVCDDATIKKLISNGQIASQYVNPNGLATMDSPYNPNGSDYAVECITSPDGRILGKMGHSERIGNNLYKNYNGNFQMNIFRSGVEYFLK